MSPATVTADVSGPSCTEFIFQFSDPRFHIIHFTWKGLQPLPDRNAFERAQDVFDDPHDSVNSESPQLFH
jgi:hypothetical protein